MVLEQLDICIKKYELILLIILYIEISSKWIRDPNVKRKGKTFKRK